MTQDHHEHPTEDDLPRPPSWISMGVSLLMDHSVVIAMLIIGVGIIAGVIGVPLIQQAREAARREQAHRDLKQLGLALRNYQAVPQTLPLPEMPNPTDERIPQTKPTP